MKLRPSPVKVRAEAAGIEILQPERARSPELLGRVLEIAPDVAVVVAYGSILPKDLLDAVPHGFVNVHFSLLPEYRGAAPVQRAVMDGKAETGVSIMVLTEGMDEGPVLAASRTEVEEAETAGELGERLAAIGGPLMVETLTSYTSGDQEPVPQDDDLATYAPKITSDEARVDWGRPAWEIRNLVRGLNPAPGAWTTFRGERVKLHVVSFVNDATDLNSEIPGTILGGDELVVRAGDGMLRLDEVQPAGKKRMDGSEMKRGMRPAAVETFE
jgi:methionyl-tRNA formyltransferase